jgi:excinuclease ABC subunit A
VTRAEREFPTRDAIVLKGVRQHNLKNIDVRIPRHRLVVVTGPSGSGKSSLAFDTLYAEGQRRYLESLSAYARQFLEQVPKPDVDRVEGLSPALAIEQKSLGRSPRSTVGTITEILPFLRVLYARLGVIAGGASSAGIRSADFDQILADVDELADGSRVTLLAPLLRGRRGEQKAQLESLRKRGFVWIRVDGETHRLEEIDALEKGKRHDLDVVIDRWVTGKGKFSRLRASVETALEVGEGDLALLLSGDRELRYSRTVSVVGGGDRVETLEPRVFSFNSPAGACPSCRGMGHRKEVSDALLVPESQLSVEDGALAPLRGRSPSFVHEQLEFLASQHGFSLTLPFESLPKIAHGLLLAGTTSERWTAWRNTLTGHESFLGDFEGMREMIRRRWQNTNSDRIRKWCEDFMADEECRECGGTRFSTLARSVQVGGLSIDQVCGMPLVELQQQLRTLRFDGARGEIAATLLSQVQRRVDFLVEAGVGYLTLARSADTLSGGEGQRVRLASQAAAGLTGALYVLDEPSIGLHARDTERLIALLKSLRDRGNTVVVVEHDYDIISAADYVIDIGPGAGEHGGEIVAESSPSELKNNSDSPTGRWLLEATHLKAPTTRGGSDRELRFLGVCDRNLQNVDCAIPLGRLVAVSGVSGSGKSTLIHHVIHRELSRRYHRATSTPGVHRAVEGHEHLDKVILIDQSAIGRSPRSTPATFTGLYTHLRQLFAQTPQAKARGFASGRFSFNTKGGRCEACSGVGMRSLSMDFLPEVQVKCDVCQGRRFDRQTLEVTYRGLNIAEYLAMSVEEMRERLSNIPSMERILATLESVGLGYLKLGQRASTVSGGEAQRLKLAKELSRPASGRTLFLLDEPTTGLHHQDVQQLVGVLQRLVERGNTVVVIEHDIDMILASDWIIDLGPEGGDEGGEVVVAGDLPTVLKCAASHTGAMLRRCLQSPSSGGS